MLIRQGLKCAICGVVFERNDAIQFDHETPHALVRSGHKPTQALHAACHATKTKTDVRLIAKAKRQALETGQQARRARRERPLLPTKPLEAGRGFDRTLTRGFDGKVQRRKP